LGDTGPGGEDDVGGQFDDRLEVDVVLTGELGGQFLARLGDGLVDPGQVSGVVAAPLVALDADGDRAERDRGLRGALTECDHSFGLFGDLRGAQCAVDLDREGPVPGVSSFGVVVTGSGATGGDAEGEKEGESDAAEAAQSGVHARAAFVPGATLPSTVGRCRAG